MWIHLLIHVKKECIIMCIKHYIYNWKRKHRSKNKPAPQYQLIFYTIRARWFLKCHLFHNIISSNWKSSQRKSVVSKSGNLLRVYRLHIGPMFCARKTACKVATYAFQFLHFLGQTRDKNVVFSEPTTHSCVVGWTYVHYILAYVLEQCTCTKSYTQ